MSVLIVVSAEPRAGRSTIAAALAYRMGSAGAPVTLVRLDGDASATADAAAFAALPYINSPGTPVALSDIDTLSGDVVAEAPPGAAPVRAGARAVAVAAPGESVSPVDAETLAGIVVTRVAASQVAAEAARDGVWAAIPEDRVLAAPSVRHIAEALGARWLVEANGHSSIERVMIGTIASDAASPYFQNRERIAVVTRFDKTDVQLAALLGDIGCMVLTGGGEPSPYLLDRVRSGPDPVAVLLAPDDTVESMRAIEGLYGASRFEGELKLARAVELLEQAGLPSAF
jgi:BioD-like phosphotransacetylase family protein